VGKSKAKDDGYEWFKACVDCGALTFRYRVRGSTRDGSQAHDEDVDGWSDADIRALAARIFDVQPSKVEVEYA